MSDSTEALERIAYLCRFLRRSYPAHADRLNAQSKTCERLAKAPTSHLRHNAIAIYDEYDRLCQVDAETARVLWDLIKQWLPAEVERCDWLGEPGRWDQHRAVDWQAIRAELRRVEAAAAQARDDDTPLVRLSQACSLTKGAVSPHTLKKRTDKPEPDVPGGNGKANLWRWPKIRDWINSEYGTSLPERFPGT